MDRQLRYFLKIAECSSLSKAADELDVSQSGLSRQLSALEAELGHALFSRTGRGVLLTEVGKKLLEGIQHPYAQVDAMIDALKEHEGVVEGSLKVATIHTLSQYFASDLLSRFVAQHRRVNLSVLARSSPDVVELVEKGRADIGFVYDSAVSTPALDSVPLFDDCMCFVVKDEGRHQSSINLLDERPPMVGFPQHFALRKMLISAGLDDLVVAEANTIDGMLRLVSLGIGGCVLPEHTSDRLLAEGGLVKLAIANPSLQRRVVAVVRNTSPVPVFARQLLEMARSFTA